MYVVCCTHVTFKIRYTSRGHLKVCINLSPEGALIPLLLSYVTCMFPLSCDPLRTTRMPFVVGRGISDMFTQVQLQRICKKLVHRWSFESFVSDRTTVRIQHFVFMLFSVTILNPDYMRYDVFYSLAIRYNAITTIEKKNSCRSQKIFEPSQKISTINTIADDHDFNRGPKLEWYLALKNCRTFCVI